MEVARKRGRKKGVTYGGIPRKHVTIYVTMSQWDRMNYLADSSGKSLSSWILNKVYSFSGIPEKLEIGSEKRFSKPLCMEIDKWEIIKIRAKECGMSISNYVLSIALSE